MSQSTDRDGMLENIYSSIQGRPTLQDNNLAVGSPSGYEFLLPKYAISTGRDGDTESISQSRIYMDESQAWFNKTDFKLGDISPEGKSYVGFLLTGVQESKSEKVQTTPLNGDNYAATFYGQSPTVYSFNGILYNTHFAPWREIFSILYDKAFRGSRISRHRKLLHVVYDNKVVSGWMLNLSQSLSASSDTMSNFSFQFLVRSETILTPTSELSYNNAYFTGSPVTGEALDTIADLPKYDDYINSARIRTPPKRQRGGSGSKRKAYGCRPGRGSTIKDGNIRKANPRFEGQNIRTGSPTSTSCDVVEAALNTIRARNSEKAKAREEFKKIKAPTKAQREAYDAKITAANERARKLLSVSWKNLTKRKKIEDNSARERANKFVETLGDNFSSKDAFIKYTLRFDAEENAPSIDSTFSSLPELKYSTPKEVKSNAT